MATRSRRVPRRNLYLVWLVAAAIVLVVGVVRIATGEPNGSGYVGVAAVIALVVLDRVKRRLRGPTRVEIAADRLHRRVVGFLFGPER